MGFDSIIPPRPQGVSVPAGLNRPPWLHGRRPRVEVARTYVAERGPDLLRAADAPVSGPFLERRVSLRRPTAR